MNHYRDLMKISENYTQFSPYAAFSSWHRWEYFQIFIEGLLGGRSTHEIRIVESTLTLPILLVID